MLIKTANEKQTFSFIKNDENADIGFWKQYLLSFNNI